MNELIQTVLVYALPVLFAITLREAAYAYSAQYFGDTTASSQGRLSLNPVSYIDWIGTVILPIVLFIATDGKFLFGYAKPAPINYSLMKNPKRDMAWVALAGLLSNFAMAFLWVIFGVILQMFSIQEEFFNKMFKAGIISNLILFALHLFPILPFDGGKILFSLLPHKYAWKFSKIEPYGMYIALGLMLLGLFQYWLEPIITLGMSILGALSKPFFYLLA